MNRLSFRFGGDHASRISTFTHGSVIALSLWLLGSSSAVANYQNPAFDRGMGAMAHRDYDGGIVDFGEAIGFNDTDPRNYLMRGQCFFHTKNYEYAIQDFNKSLEYAPNNYEAYLWRGTAHANLGKDDFAIKDYEQAIKLAPALADKFFNQPADDLVTHGRGRVISGTGRAQIVTGPGTYEDKGLNQNAIRSYKEAMSLVYPNRGNGARQRLQALQNNPSADVHVDSMNNADVSSDVSLNARRNNRVVRSLDTDPNRGEFGPIPGTREFRGDVEQAVTRMNEAIKNDETNPENYFRRAKAYQKMMNVGRAMTDYNDAIRWGPNESKYYIGRASLFHQLGKSYLVQADIERARRCNPDLPEKITFQGEPFPPSVRRSASVPDQN